MSLHTWRLRCAAALGISLALLCGDTLLSEPGDLSPPASLSQSGAQSTSASVPQVIGIGEVTGTLAPQRGTPTGTVPAVTEMLFDFTAPADGTLIVELDWDPALDILTLYLEDAPFDFWPPTVATLEVAAGQTYRIAVASNTPWDLFDDVPFVLTVTLTSGPVAVPRGCQSAPPGVNWICVDGGWVPPDHPLAIVDSPGSPSAPPVQAPPGTLAGCRTVRPAPTWVCVNGGWLPPDHPVAIPPPPDSTPPPPGGCTTPDPFVGIPGLVGVCVGGAWVPAGHPLAGGGR